MRWFTINASCRVIGAIAVVIAAFAPLFGRWDIMFLGGSIFMFEHAISAQIFTRFFCSRCGKNFGKNVKRGARYWEQIDSKRSKLTHLCSTCTTNNEWSRSHWW